MASPARVLALHAHPDDLEFQCAGTLALLRQARRANQWVALVDAQDSFDPSKLGEAVFSRLVWVRCRDAAQALKATDLLLRDGNLPLVLLDLQMNPAAELRKIPATTWHRWQRLSTEDLQLRTTKCRGTKTRRECADQRIRTWQSKKQQFLRQPRSPDTWPVRHSVGAANVGGAGGIE